MSTALGRAFVYCAPLLVVLVGLLLWNPSGDFWKTVEPPKAQCEAYLGDRVRMPAILSMDVYDPAKLNRLIREPQNTISNLPYAIVGLAILLVARKPASIGLGLAAIFLGFGSGIYHASLLPEWRMVDILGVYAVLYLLLLVGAGTIWTGISKGWVAWLLTVLIWLAAIFTGVHRNDIRVGGFKLFDSTYVFVACVVLGVAFALGAWFKARDRVAYLRALQVFVISTVVCFAGGIGDRFNGFWAGPDIFIQGHAVWHTLGAVSLLAGYVIFTAAGFDTSLVTKRASMSE